MPYVWPGANGGSRLPSLSILSRATRGFSLEVNIMNIVCLIHSYLLCLFVQSLLDPLRMNVLVEEMCCFLPPRHYNSHVPLQACACTNLLYANSKTLGGGKIAFFKLLTMRLAICNSITFQAEQGSHISTKNVSLGTITMALSPPKQKFVNVSSWPWSFKGVPKLGVKL